MKENKITNEQAVRLAVSYAEYARIRVCELDTPMDIRLAIMACRGLRDVQEETGVEVVGLNRDGDPTLPKMITKLQRMLEVDELVLNIVSRRK